MIGVAAALSASAFVSDLAKSAQSPLTASSNSIGSPIQDDPFLALMLNLLMNPPKTPGSMPKAVPKEVGDDEHRDKDETAVVTAVGAPISAVPVVGADPTSVQKTGPEPDAPARASQPTFTAASGSDTSGLIQGQAAKPTDAPVQAPLPSLARAPGLDTTGLIKGQASPEPDAPARARLPSLARASGSGTTGLIKDKVASPVPDASAKVPLQSLASASGSEENVLQEVKPQPMQPAAPIAMDDGDAVEAVKPHASDDSRSIETARVDFAHSVAHAAQASDASKTESNKHVDNARPVAPVSEQIHEAVAAHLANLREGGRLEVHMSLHPAELGPVKLHLDLQGERLNIRFLVQSDASRTALDQQAEPLRVRFAEMGLSLGQFDVRRDGTMSHHPSNSDGQGDGQFRSSGQPENVLAAKPYFRLAKPNPGVDVIA
jgi:flagellar hook-length control protein FliK